MEDADGINPLEELQRRLMAAYAEQLAEHDHSMQVFIGKIANLYEAGNSDANDFCASLRQLQSGKVLQQNGGELPPMYSGFQKPVVNDAWENQVEDTPLTLQGDLPRNGCTGEKQLTPGLLHQESMETKAGNRQPCFGGVGVPDHIIADNKFNNLTFINEDGSMIKGITLLERVGGHRIKCCKAWVARRLECCHPMHGCFANFVGSTWFKLVSAVVIVLNFFFIIAQSDYKLINVNKEETSTMFLMGYSFTAFYLVELIILITVNGRNFFLGPEMGWNLFDMAIVVVACAEILVKMLGLPFVNTSFLRILRFFKLSRVLRMFSALRMVKEIRIMVDALAGCITLYVFCCGMLCIFLSVFAIFFVQGFASYLEETPDVSLEELEGIHAHFGDVSTAMLSLFMACTGGDDWSVFYATLLPLGSVYKTLFTVFISAYSLAFFTVITGVFCEKAMSLALPTVSELIEKRFMDQHRDAKELMYLLKTHCEDDGSHTVTLAQLDAFLDNPQVELYFEVRGLTPTSCRKFFNVLCDLQGSDSVDYVTFISALVRLDGKASSIDAQCLSMRQLHGLHQMTKMHDESSAEMAELLRLTRKEITAVSATVNVHSVQLQRPFSVVRQQARCPHAQADPEPHAGSPYPPGKHVEGALSL